MFCKVIFAKSSQIILGVWLCPGANETCMSVAVGRQHTCVVTQSYAMDLELRSCLPLDLSKPVWDGACGLLSPSLPASALEKGFCPFPILAADPHSFPLIF